MKTILIAITLLSAVPVSAQTFCSRIGSSVVCQGDNLSSFTYTPSSRDSGVGMDHKGNLYFNNNGTIIESESQSFRDSERRSAERRRELIYGDRESSRDSRKRDRDEKW